MAILPVNQAQLLSAVSGVSLVTTATTADAELAFTTGQLVKAEVQLLMPDNKVQVQIATEQFIMELPMAVEVGQTVEMTFITDKPRAAFALISQSADANPVTLSDSALRLAMLTTQETVQTGQAPLFSPLSGSVHTRTTVTELQAMLSGEAVDAKQLALHLQQYVKESGLFYESHLARWFSGDYPLEALLREPQGLKSRRIPSADQHTTAAVDTPAEQLPGEVQEQAAKTIKTAITSNSSHEVAAEQKSQSLLNEQLRALQSGQFCIKSDYPGGLEFKVSERKEGRQQSGDMKRSWDTSIALDLPELGRVRADVTYDGKAVSINITAASENAAGVLKDGEYRLLEQLDGAGIVNSGLRIGHAAR